MSISSIQSLDTKYVRIAYAAIASMLLLAFLSAPIGVAHGDPSVEVSGDWQTGPDGHATLLRIADGNFFFLFTGTIEFTAGELDGAATFELAASIKKDGSIVFNGPGIYTGSINTVEGECRVQWHGNIDPTNSIEGLHMTLHKCTDDLKGSSGHINFSGEPGPGGSGSYSGRVHPPN